MILSKQRNPRRSAAQWHQIVEAQQASGLSAPKFCKEKDISYPSFMNWKKKLMDKSTKPEEKLLAFIELTPPFLPRLTGIGILFYQRSFGFQVRYNHMEIADLRVIDCGGNGGAADRH